MDKYYNGEDEPREGVVIVAAVGGGPIGSIDHLGPGAWDFVGFALEDGSETISTTGLVFIPASNVTLVGVANQVAGIRQMLVPLFVEPRVEIKRLAHSVHARRVMGRVVVKMVCHPLVANLLLGFEPVVAATAENKDDPASCGYDD